MNKLEWNKNVARYNKYTFRVGYNPKTERWHATIEIFPFRAMFTIADFYTSEQEAKDACEVHLNHRLRS